MKAYPTIKPRSLTDVASEAILQKELERQAPSTGLKNLDECVKGFLPKHLYTLTGETNSGKTLVACNFADAVAKQGFKVLYVALEPDINIINTLTSVRLNKPYRDLTENDLKFDMGMIDILLQEDVQDLQHLIHIVSTTGHQYKFILIDHISYFITGDNTNQAQGKALKQLALLAKTHNTAVLLIAHLRKGIQGYITMDDISGSAAFKQDSTEVLIIQRKRENPDDELSPFSEIGKIYVPKTKVYSNKRFADIKFQDGNAKLINL